MENTENKGVVAETTDVIKAKAEVTSAKINELKDKRAVQKAVKAALSDGNISDEEQAQINEAAVKVEESKKKVAEAKEVLKQEKAEAGAAWKQFCKNIFKKKKED